MALPPTPSQTIGPFFPFALLNEDRSKLVAPDHPSAISIEGTVYDGVAGFGRCGTDDEGHYEFLTIKPGPVPDPDGRPLTPHIWVSVFARGLLKRVTTRVYFPDEEEANAVDPVFASIENPDLRSTLVARPAHEDGPLLFDIRLQGHHQTAFFDV